MEEIIKGHKYRLRNLKDDDKLGQILNFYMDPEIHEGTSQTGTSCQEVIRALIARVKTLNDEKPHYVNDKIISHLRECLVFFEMRALLNKAKLGFEVENIPILPDGHIGFTNDESVINALDLVHFYIDATQSELDFHDVTRDDVLKQAHETREVVDPMERRGLRQRYCLDFLRPSKD